jgi:2,3-bisphosphoglycerate-dependent phosphoglycerate mutase
MGITTAYLIRHAHSEWADDDERPLSHSGLAAADDLADLLSRLPIAAIYSSPFRRSVQTVTPLANRLGLHVELLSDLRERSLPAVPASEFQQLVEAAWRFPKKGMAGGESNVTARVRGIAGVRRIIMRHDGHHVVIATHGNLFALILNGLNPRFGYTTFLQLSFPDVYRLEFDAGALTRIERIWEQA